jgi:hypothetical protein
MAGGIARRMATADRTVFSPTAVPRSLALQDSDPGENERMAGIAIKVSTQPRN